MTWAWDQVRLSCFQPGAAAAVAAATATATGPGETSRASASPYIREVQSVRILEHLCTDGKQRAAPFPVMQAIAPSIGILVPSATCWSRLPSPGRAGYRCHARRTIASAYCRNSSSWQGPWAAVAVSRVAASMPGGDSCVCRTQDPPAVALHSKRSRAPAGDRSESLPQAHSQDACRCSPSAAGPARISAEHTPGAVAH